MLLVPGGADAALASAVRFYTASGFTSEGIAQLRGNTESGAGTYRIVMVAMNRDHSAAETDLTIAVSLG